MIPLFFLNYSYLINRMKKYFAALCAIMALFFVSACEPEEKPDPQKDEFDHIEFRSGFEVSQDVIEYFDLVYDILSNNKSISSGTMSGEFKPIEVKSGIKDGPFEVHINFKATDKIYKEWDMWKEYVISKNCFIGLYSVSKKGVESELIKITYEFPNATFGTFVEENLPEMVSSIEDILNINEKIIIEDNGSNIRYL